MIRNRGQERDGREPKRLPCGLRLPEWVPQNKSINAWEACFSNKMNNSNDKKTNRYNEPHGQCYQRKVSNAGNQKRLPRCLQLPGWAPRNFAAPRHFNVSQAIIILF